MLFEKLSGLVIRFKWVIVICWIIIVGAIFWLTPSLSKVASTDQSSFLPASSDTIQASKMIKQLYPNKGTGSSIVLVFERAGGLKTEDMEYAVKLENYLKSKPAFEVKEVSSPFTNDKFKVEMLSKNKDAAFIVVNLSVPGYKEITSNIVLKLRDITQAKNELQRGDAPTAPEGLILHVTGDAAFGQEQIDNVQKSMAMTGIITVFLVIIVLIIIYRSPIAFIIPLMTIGISFLTSRGIVAALTTMGLQVSSFTQTFLIAVLFGAGTDYCLLLASRFREDLAKGNNSRDALKTALTKSGTAIVSSGFTVIIGFAVMATAKFGLYKTTGPSIAIGVAITIIAVMTLTPAMLAILGESVFWPAHPSKNPEKEKEGSPFWNKLSVAVTSKPARFIIVCLVIFIPFIVSTIGLRRTFDQLEELPSNSDAKQGFQVISSHFNQGVVLPVKVVLKTDKSLWTNESLQVIDEIAIDITKVDGVAKVRTATRPLGEQINETTLPKQVELLSSGLGDLDGKFDQIINGLDKTQTGTKQVIQGISARLNNEQTLESKLVMATLSEKMKEISDGIQKSSDGLLKIKAGLKSAQDITKNYTSKNSNLNGEFYLPEGALNNPELKKAMEYYISPDGKGITFDVILSLSPYSQKALDSIDKIREAISFGIKNTSLNKAEFHITGASSSVSAMRDITAEDFIKVVFFVLLGIFIVLAFLLRSITAPIYLILTILFSYATTMGITYLVFQVGMGKVGLSWSAPFFSFCILVALGVDYNIFLMARVKEEYIPGDVKGGIARALASTGKIITSCGIIMAGTFGAMLVSPVTQLCEIGFATVVGLLIDTFIIRCLMVPAIAVKVGELNWWPGRRVKVIPYEKDEDIKIQR